MEAPFPSNYDFVCGHFAQRGWEPIGNPHAPAGWGEFHEHTVERAERPAVSVPFTVTVHVLKDRVLFALGSPRLRVAEPFVMPVAAALACWNAEGGIVGGWEMDATDGVARYRVAVDLDLVRLTARLADGVAAQAATGVTAFLSALLNVIEATAAQEPTYEGPPYVLEDLCGDGEA